MSDTETVFDRLDAMDEPAPGTNGKEPCPECGKMFVPGPGMGVHRAAVHGVQSKTGRPRKECPQCNKWFSSKDMNRHLRAVHGVDPAKRRLGRPPKVRTDPALDAEQIVRAAAGVLWPEGIPSQHLEGLLRWYKQTEEFLATAQG